MALSSFERPGPPNRPPMVWLHGWTMDHRILVPMAERFADRAHLLVDLAGHGASAGEDALAIADHAGAVSTLLAERLSRPAVLIGHSMGGQVALEVAAQAPAQLKAAILLDPAHLDPPEATASFAARLAARLKTEGEAGLERFLDRQFATSEGRAAAEPWLAAIERPPFERVCAQWDAIRHHDGRPALARLSVPVLALLAPQPVNPPEALEPWLETETVQGTGHMLMFDAPDRVEAAIRTFLQRIENGTARPARD